MSDAVPVDLARRMKAALSTVEISPGNRVEVMTRAYMDAEIKAHGFDGALGISGCGQPNINAVYVEKLGLVVFFCAECDGKLGAVRVAADA